MSTNRRKFTEEFKADAVQLVVQGQLPIAQVARELEVNESSLGCWVKAYRVQHSDPETPPPPLEAARVARLEAENRRLAEENAFLVRILSYQACRRLPAERSGAGIVGLDQAAGCRVTV